ncbi:hypothetical protein GUJ93_ZPchr0014g46943 [Zizania palustris]|uniref:Uncharacterized protein n=1 Tax=Zizania palustris TaxID=103762 RepID=A0A8J5VUY4_ZIZPA|nr:hypothetical protein GUJ93_ZPchr0014g46943 [Zizania palustris]
MPLCDEDKYDIEETVDGVEWLLLTKEQWEIHQRQHHGEKCVCEDGTKSSGHEKDDLNGNDDGNSSVWSEASQHL